MKRLFQRAGSRKGALFLELMIAGVVLWLAIAAFTSGIGSFSKASRLSGMSIQRQRLINAMVERIRDNPTEFQGSQYVAGSPEGEAELERLKNNLPLGFFNGQSFFPADQCTDCPGRSGVLLQSVPSAQSLSMVTLFIKHEQYFPQNEIKVVRFVVAPVR